MKRLSQQCLNAESIQKVRKVTYLRNSVEEALQSIFSELKIDGLYVTEAI
jgi:hypothetical protein